MAVEYSCIFGISSPVKGLNLGEQVNAFSNYRTIIMIQGKYGRIYWLVIQKLQKKYIYPNSPRFTSSDAADAAERLRDVVIYQDITFGAIWDSRETASMTALEENVFQTWHYGRMVLIGDSVHKVPMQIFQRRCGNRILNNLDVCTDDSKPWPRGEYGDRGCGGTGDANQQPP
jgi:FAD dependent monooxygenase